MLGFHHYKHDFWLIKLMLRIGNIAPLNKNNPFKNMVNSSACEGSVSAYSLRLQLFNYKSCNVSFQVVSCFCVCDHAKMKTTVL